MSGNRFPRVISGGPSGPPHHPDCPCPDCELDRPPVPPEGVNWCVVCRDEIEQGDICRPCHEAERAEASLRRVGVA